MFAAHAAPMDFKGCLVYLPQASSTCAIIHTQLKPQTPDDLMDEDGPSITNHHQPINRAPVKAEHRKIADGGRHAIAIRDNRGNIHLTFLGIVAVGVLDAVGPPRKWAVIFPSLSNLHH